MAEIIKLGSLYFDGQPQEVGSEYNDGQITFGPAVPGKELQWVKANGLLIADRCICTDIGWDQLHAQGLVFGTPIQIDGKFYLCRCLKVGAENGTPNEWDAVLDASNESDEFWHWRSRFFWGQEIVNASYCAVRGYFSARYWGNSAASYRSVRVGFRPALDPLGSESCSPDALIGKQARIYGPSGTTLEGRLLSADDYDLMLDTPTALLNARGWSLMDSGRTILDRTRANWLKEVEG